MRRHSILLAALLLASCATSSTTRVDEFALVQKLNGELLASNSATQTLQSRCSDHKIVAVRMGTAAKVPSTDQLQRLGVASADDVRHRHVELRCGERVFSEADNWYVPARLTPEMNRTLDTTDTPFGAVVRPLQPYRKTLEAVVLWSSPEQAIPREVLQHRAVLYTADHQPFAEVVERYRFRSAVAKPPLW